MRVDALNLLKLLLFSDFDEKYAKKIQVSLKFRPVGAPPGEVPILS